MNLQKLTIKGLEQKLAIAVKEEDFETASSIRDELARRDENLQAGSVDGLIYTMDRDAQIRTIIKSIDFDRILIVMEALNWKWRFEDVTLEHLKSSAEQLLIDVWEAPEYDLRQGFGEVSTGGFTASIYIENNIKTLGLRFSIEDVNLSEDDIHLTEEEYDEAFFGSGLWNEKDDEDDEEI